MRKFYKTEPITPRTKHQSLPRLGLTISKEQHTGLGRIPWGQKTMLFHNLIDDLNNMIDEIGIELVIAKILGQTLHIQELFAHEAATPIPKASPLFTSPVCRPVETGSREEDEEDEEDDLGYTQ